MSATSLISKITSSDKNLLENAVARFRPNSKNYEDSWGYVIQATRYAKLKWHDPKTGSLIFFGKKSETDPTLVIPTYFAEHKYLARIVQKAQETLGSEKTILKNVNYEEIPDLTQCGFRQYKEGEEWCADTPFDDQTYPQLIIDLKRLFAKKGNKYKKLRTALNKKPKITIRKFHKTDFNDVESLFKSKDKKGKKNNRETGGMYYSSHTMYLSANLDRFIINKDSTGETLGFTATSNITPKTTALVAAIFKPGLKISSVWGIYHTLEYKFYEGYELANLGGNERVGSFNFMRRTFVSREQLKKLHMIYDPSSALA